jgi:hypothetical protein
MQNTKSRQKFKPVRLGKMSIRVKGKFGLGAWLAASLCSVQLVYGLRIRRFTLQLLLLYLVPEVLTRSRPCHGSVRRPVTSGTRPRSETSPYGICGEQSVSGTGCTPSTSVFPAIILPPMPHSPILIMYHAIDNVQANRVGKIEEIREP